MKKVEKASIEQVKESEKLVETIHKLVKEISKAGKFRVDYTENYANESVGLVIFKVNKGKDWTQYPQFTTVTKGSAGFVTEETTEVQAVKNLEKLSRIVKALESYLK